jgi:hypothetical protein
MAVIGDGVFEIAEGRACKHGIDHGFYRGKELYNYFDALFRRAIEYDSNPRNLEAFWKPVHPS